MPEQPEQNAAKEKGDGQKTANEQVPKPTAQPVGNLAGVDDARGLLASLDPEQTKDRNDALDGPLTADQAKLILAGSFRYSQGDADLQDTIFVALHRFYPNMSIAEDKKGEVVPHIVTLYEKMSSPKDERHKIHTIAEQNPKETADTAWKEFTVRLRGKPVSDEVWEGARMDFLYQFLQRDIKFITSERDYGDAHDKFASQFVDLVVREKQTMPGFEPLFDDMRGLVDELMSTPFDVFGKASDDVTLGVFVMLSKLRDEYNKTSTKTDAHFKHDPVEFPEEWQKRMDEISSEFPEDWEERMRSIEEEFK